MIQTSASLGIPKGVSLSKDWYKIIVLAVLAASLSISACNTVSGAGRDVKSVGGAVTESAEDAKK